MKGPRTANLGDLKLTVTRAHGVEDRKRAVVVAELSRADAPFDIEQSAQHPEYGFFLVAPDGKRYPGKVVPRDQTVHLTPGTATIFWFHLPKGVHVHIRHEDGKDEMIYARKGQLAVEFNNLPKLEGIWSFVWVMTEHTTSREYEFKAEHLLRP